MLAIISSAHRQADLTRWQRRHTTTSDERLRGSDSENTTAPEGHRQRWRPHAVCMVLHEWLWAA